MPTLCIALTKRIIVRLELLLFDIYSISYPGYDKILSLSIIRPEITVLFRLFDQFSRYSALFCVSREDKNANAALGNRKLQQKVSVPAGSMRGIPVTSK